MTRTMQFGWAILALATAACSGAGPVAAPSANGGYESPSSSFENNGGLEGSNGVATNTNTGTATGTNTGTNTGTGDTSGTGTGTGTGTSTGSAAGCLSSCSGSLTCTITGSTQPSTLTLASSGSDCAGTDTTGTTVTFKCGGAIESGSDTVGAWAKSGNTIAIELQSTDSSGATTTTSGSCTR